MKMSRENSSLVVFVMMVVVLLIHSASATSTKGNVPSCLSKLAGCAANNPHTNVPDSSNPEPVCCSEWADVIANDTKCVCDNFGTSITSSPFTAEYFSLCKINASPDTLCKGMAMSPTTAPGPAPIPAANTPNASPSPTGESADRASSGAWTGPVSGVMLFMTAMTGLMFY